MTIYALTSNKPGTRSGFTLLEIIIVLAVFMLFVTTAASFITARGSNELGVFTEEFNHFVDDTRDLALRNDKTLYIVFSRDHIWRTVSMNTEKPRPNEESLDLPKGVNVLLNKESRGWVQMERSNQTVVWLFSRSGCCGPMQVRFVNDREDRAFEYDVLSATPIDDE